MRVVVDGAAVNEIAIDVFVTESPETPNAFDQLLEVVGVNVPLNVAPAEPVESVPANVMDWTVGDPPCCNVPDVKVPVPETLTVAVLPLTFTVNPMVFICNDIADDASPARYQPCGTGAVRAMVVGGLDVTAYVATATEMSAGRTLEVSAAGNCVSPTAVS